VKPLLTSAVPFEVGALYSRKHDIHGRFGGQQQGGISTPVGHPYVILFTGEVGASHGYGDKWDEDDVLHYFGEGQSGDMRYTGGNKAILRHDLEGKKLLVFQMMGKRQPYRYLGEFRRIGQYEQQGVRDTSGKPRMAIVFKLAPVGVSIFEELAAEKKLKDSKPELDLESTVGKALVAVRKKQTLFRHRLVSLEKGCRLTGIRDLRFLRASHIKPWAACESGTERTDGNNGLLLSSQADHLFDQGWISFSDGGELIRADEFPVEVVNRLGLDLKPGRPCGPMRREQQKYLDFHRHEVLGRKFKKLEQPIETLLKDLTAASRPEEYGSG
jgi:5-methylcytosine-specific restriction protein A